MSRILRVAVIAALAAILAACGLGNPNQEGRYNAPSYNPKPSNRLFAEALSRAGYSGVRLSYDESDGKWSATTTVNACRIEIDESRMKDEYFGFEIDKVGTKDSVTAQNLGLTTLSNVPKKLLASALSMPVLRSGKPVTNSKQFGC